MSTRKSSRSGTLRPLTLAGLTLAALLLVTLGRGASHAAPARPGAHPLAAHMQPRSSWVSFDAVVIESLAAGPYRYLRVQSEGRESWVVTLARGAPASSAVRVTVLGRASAFRSARLDREFEELLFAIVRAAPRAAVPHPRNQEVRP